MSIHIELVLLLFLLAVTILRPKSWSKKKILNWVIIRELDGVPSTKLSILYMLSY